MGAVDKYTLLHIKFLDPLRVPRLTVDTATSIGVEYRVERSDNITTRVITGYEVLRFGVPMIGEYMNTGRGRRVMISPAVPGAQYRITAWALDSGTKRSATPAVKSVTTGGASEGRHQSTRDLKDITYNVTIKNIEFCTLFCIMHIRI